MSALSWVRGERDSAKALWQEANDLKARFNRDWWMEDEGFFALALDPEKRQVRALTSNVGQCIATGIIDGEHLPRVVDRMFEPDLFSGWGVRTLSTTDRSYNPVDYHLGSVWAVENASTVFGLARFGFRDRAAELSEGLFALARLYPDYRIPETVGGYARSDRPFPGAYPRSNTPQLWNASVFPMLLQSVLGLQPLAPLQLLVVDPHLPEWLPDVTIRRLKVGNAVATVRFWRDGHGDSHARILNKRGTLRLVRQPPIESLTDGIPERFGALVDTFVHSVPARTKARWAVSVGAGIAIAAGVRAVRARRRRRGSTRAAHSP
jgi:glycogen debranching enzyme